MSEARTTHLEHLRKIADDYVNNYRDSFWGGANPLNLAIDSLARKPPILTETDDDFEMIEALSTTQGINIRTFNVCQGDTALMLALRYENCKMAKKLIELGADVFDVSNQGGGYSAFYLAVHAGTNIRDVNTIDVDEIKSLIRLFIFKGVDANAPCNDWSSRIPGRGRGPLPLSAAGTIEAAELLIELGADVNNVHPFLGTVLDQIAENIRSKHHYRGHRLSYFCVMYQLLVEKYGAVHESVSALTSRELADIHFGPKADFNSVAPEDNCTVLDRVAAWVRDPSHYWRFQRKYFCEMYKVLSTEQGATHHSVAALTAEETA